MKRLRTILLLMMVSLVTVTANSQQFEDNLFLEGKVISGEKVILEVFEYNDSSQTWNRVSVSKEKKKYHVNLKTDANYQLWFNSPKGIKILYVLEGTVNSHYMQMDVDFNNKNIYNVLYQKGHKYKTLKLDNIESRAKPKELKYILEENV